MIPREILKKIRQIELRTNRIVTEMGAACFDGKRKSVFSSALTCVLSPRRGFQPSTLSASSAVHSANPVTSHFQVAAGVSPSPWGEGRDEGGHGLNISPANGHFRPAAGVNARKAAYFNVLSRFFAVRTGLSTPETASSNHGMGCFNSGFDPNNRGNAWKNSENASENGGGHFGKWGACLGKWGEGSGKRGGRLGQR